MFYKTDNGEVLVEILLYQENLWLTQAKMAELFEVQKVAILKYLKNMLCSAILYSKHIFLFDQGNALLVTICYFERSMLLISNKLN